jgi:hypothetical protein
MVVSNGKLRLWIRVDVNAEVAIQMTVNAKLQADVGEAIVL